MKFLELKKQRGMTMTELGVVLAISGAILALGMTVVPAQMAKIRANKVVDALNMAIPNIQTAYQNFPNLGALTTQQVATNGWIQDSLIEKTAAGVPTGTISTPWADGTIEFGPHAAGNSYGKITINAVPRRECSRIADSMLANDVVLSAGVNDATGVNVKALGGTINFTTVGTQCSNSNSSTVVLIFGRG